MMTPSQIENIRDSFRAVAPRADDLAEQFFDTLFTREPFLRSVFPTDHWLRARDLLGGLALLLKHLHRIDTIELSLAELGAKAQRAGVSPHHYGRARQAMIDTLRSMDPDWSDDLEGDWTQALNAASSLVLLGAGRARAKAA